MIKVGDLYKNNVSNDLILITEVRLATIFVYNLKQDIERSFPRTFMQKIIDEATIVLVSRAEDEK